MVTRRRRPPRSTRAAEAFGVVDFWAVLASMPPGTPVRTMVAALRSLPPTSRLAFDQHLADAVAALDTAEHRREMALAYETSLPGDPDVGWAAGAPTPPRAMPVELQLTVVALGEDGWTAVARNPALLRGAWPTQLGRRLAHALAVADPSDRSDQTGPDDPSVRRA